MARTLNFDAVVVDTIDITKGGQTFSLRDDVPMTTLVRVFGLIEHQAAMKGRSKITPEQAEDWAAELEQRTLEICGAIFRHTDPEMTDEEIARLFSWEEQSQLVMLFFTTRYSALEKQANEQNASLPPSAEESESSATPRRAGQAGQAAQRVSSATVSPRSRQSHGAVAATTRRKR